MNVIYRLEALNDLNEQLSYIHSQSPKNAALVGERVARSVSQLEIFPLAGRKGHTPGTYELVIQKTRLIAVYAIRSNFVEIIAIFSTDTDRPRGSNEQ